MSELRNFADCCMQTMRKILSVLGPLTSRYQNTLMLISVGFILICLLCSIAFVGSVLAHIAMILLAFTAIGMLVIDAMNDYQERKLKAKIKYAAHT
jgi:CHASE2 domain-containing sensor protein